MEDKTIVFTFKYMGRMNWTIYTKSGLVDKADKNIETKAIDFRFDMKRLTEKYNDRNISVLFDYEG